MFRGYLLLDCGTNWSVCICGFVTDKNKKQPPLSLRFSRICRSAIEKIQMGRRFLDIKQVMTLVCG